jgi:hypothetical protein
LIKDQVCISDAKLLDSTEKGLEMDGRYEYGGFDDEMKEEGGYGHGGYDSAEGSRRGRAGMSQQGLIAAVRSESRRIAEKTRVEREMYKEDLLAERRERAYRKQAAQVRNVQKTRRKMKASPFAVDMMAESERIEEENRIRLREQARRSRAIGSKKERVKNDIIRKALAEASDLEALRAEKRAIALEEKRLKALIDLERAKAHKKSDLQAAVKAEKERQAKRKAYAREQFAMLTEERQGLEASLLRDKHALPAPKESDQW